MTDFPPGYHFFTVMKDFLPPYRFTTAIKQNFDLDETFSTSAALHNHKETFQTSIRVVYCTKMLKLCSKLFQ